MVLYLGSANGFLNVITLDTSLLLLLERFVRKTTGRTINESDKRSCIENTENCCVFSWPQLMMGNKWNKYFIIAKLEEETFFFFFKKFDHHSYLFVFITVSLIKCNCVRCLLTIE